MINNNDSGILKKIKKWWNLYKRRSMKAIIVMGLEFIMRQIFPSRQKWLRFESYLDRLAIKSLTSRSSSITSLALFCHKFCLLCVARALYLLCHKWMELKCQFDLLCLWIYYCCLIRWLISKLFSLKSINFLLFRCC